MAGEPGEMFWSLGCNCCTFKCY